MVEHDASYRLHFADAESFRAAMRQAAALEAKGLHRRAWRVRWNLDGPQPVMAAAPVEPEGPPTAAQLIKEIGLPQLKIAKLLGVSQQGVCKWARGCRIPPQQYAKLARLAEKLR